MKMTIADFEVRLMGFARQLVRTPKEGLNRFSAGLALTAKARDLEKFLISAADAEGKIDTAWIKSLVDSGFDAADGSIKIMIGHPMLKLIGAAPELVTIKKEDADQFFAALG